MALKPEERKVIIDDLVTNCECWKSAGDRELLNSFPDEKLASIKVEFDRQRQAIRVANAAVGGFTDGTTAYRINPETGNWEKGSVPQQAQTPSNPPAPTHQPPVPAPAPTQNVDPRPAPRRPQTMEEWLRDAPAEIQNRFSYLGAIEQREKDKVITQILSNVAECDRRAQYERLSRYQLEELMNIYSLMPKSVPLDDQPRSPQKGRGRQVETDEDMLLMPTMNWTEVSGQSGQNGGHSTAGSQSSSAASLSEPTEDEWLRNAPPHIRNQLQEANAVLERERRKLINELTQGITDEESQGRLVQRLQNKSVEELRDLLVLQPRRDANRQISFFGSSAPVTTNRSPSGNESGDDILPLPKIDWNEVRRQA